MHNKQQNGQNVSRYVLEDERSGNRLAWNATFGDGVYLRILYLSFHGKILLKSSNGKMVFSSSKENKRLMSE